MDGKLGQVMGADSWLVIYNTEGEHGPIENIIPVAPDTDTTGFYIDAPVTFDIVGEYAVITSVTTTTTTTINEPQFDQA